jgi:asparagine synthase (glutamine-hydrolysing)
MCGIAGVIHFDGEPVDVGVIRRMTDAIAHRGPDGEGQWIDGPVGIGHRRLAVLDPTPAGSQPMFDDSGRYVLSYNGEVYNFRELRAELTYLGTTFRSGTDTEVVLQALIRWGTSALSMFNGMFALAFHDRLEGRFLLARDRYGIKPLYYQETDKGLAFASEARAIRELPGYEADLDLEALVEYFTFQNIFTDRTFDKGIRLLPSGTHLVVDLHGEQRLTATRYWDYQFEEPTDRVEVAGYAEELDRLFVQAVERNLISDVEVGSFLSGGLDSGSITAVASSRVPKLKTFTCGFDMESVVGIELAFDERAVATHAAAMYGTNHSEIALRSGDMERVMSDVVFHIEEPRVGQSYPNYFAAQLASDQVKVVLSGAGGDEMFGGYPWRYYTNSDGGSFDEYIDNYYLYWQRLISNSRLHRLFEPIRSQIEHVSTRDIFRDVFPAELRMADTPQDYVNRSLYFEARTFLHGLLTVDDKLSMAHGLETRVPFLDNDLVDFAMSCPVDLKLRNPDAGYRIDENTPTNKTDMYFQKTHDGKLILRSALNHYLPPEVVGGAKQGFSGPDATWFRGESLEYVKSRLLASSNGLDGIAAPSVVSEILEEHASGKANNRLAIWSLLYVEDLIGQTYR